MVRADDSVSIATTDPMYWELEDFWIQKQDILLLKSYAYACISHALSYNIIYYWLSVQLCLKLM